MAERQSEAAEPGLAEDALWLYYPYGNTGHQRVKGYDRENSTDRVLA